MLKQSFGDKLLISEGLLKGREQPENLLLQYR